MKFVKKRLKQNFRLSWILYAVISASCAGISVFTDWFQRFSIDRFFEIQGAWMGAGISCFIVWSILIEAFSSYQKGEEADDKPSHHSPSH